MWQEVMWQEVMWYDKSCDLRISSLHVKTPKGEVMLDFLITPAVIQRNTLVCVNFEKWNCVSFYVEVLWFEISFGENKISNYSMWNYSLYSFYTLCNMAGLSIYIFSEYFSPVNKLSNSDDNDLLLLCFNAKAISLTMSFGTIQFNCEFHFCQSFCCLENLWNFSMLLFIFVSKRSL